MVSKARLKNAARTAVRTCVKVRKRDTVLVVTDEPSRTIGYALLHAAREIAPESYLIEIPPLETNGQEPPAEVARMMREVDVLFCPTAKSLTHTNARRNASAKGVRGATLPGVTEEMMVRCLSADYSKVAARSRKLARMLDRADEIRVASPAGTDLVLPCKGRRSIANTGLFHKRGFIGNLPAGETYLAPVEGKTSGTFVAEGSMAGVGKLHRPIRISIEKGLATDIRGGAEARKLKKILSPFGKKGRNVAEFGIGTNDRARVTGVILEDEKVMGTVHVALGDNKSMGGSVDVASHLDGLILEPTVWIGKTKVLERGKVLF